MFNLPASPRVAFDQLPPQNIEAEEALLGSLLLDDSTIDLVSEFLLPEDLYRDSYQIICRRIFEIRAAGSAVDGLILIEKLDSTGELAQVGGDDTIRRLLEAPPHSVNAVYYAEIVRQKAIARRLIEAHSQCIRDAYSNNFNADDLVRMSEESVFAVGDARVTTEISDLASGLSEAEALSMRRRHGDVAGVRSGWQELDDMLDGFQPGTLAIVASRPGGGKSAFAHGVLGHSAVSQGITPFLASMEMTRQDVATRMLQAAAFVDSYRLRKPWLLSPDEAERLHHASEALKARTFPIDDNSSRTIGQLAAAARRQKARRKIGLMVVDYLQLIEGDDVRSNRQEQIARASRGLKVLARQLSIPIIALSQINRAVESRQDHNPRLSDLRESGAIEQDADVVILLHRPVMFDENANPMEAHAIVAKNRNGPTGTVRLTFSRQFARFDGLGEDEASGEF